MEIVNTLDIDGTQWEITDTQARNDIANLKLSLEEALKMDKVTKFPDWSNQQTISFTEITVDQDVYIMLNELTYKKTEGLKINGKEVSVSDVDKEVYSTTFSGYVKKGSVVSHPHLTDPTIVKVFPLI